MKTFLHVGCGQLNKFNCQGFENDDWNEIRLDIDESVNPDIVGSLTDMSLVENESVDAIYSSHNIEHFPDPLAAIFEWDRVLRAGGYVPCCSLWLGLCLWLGLRLALFRSNVSLVSSLGGDE